MLPCQTVWGEERWARWWSPVTKPLFTELTKERDSALCADTLTRALSSHEHDFTGAADFRCTWLKDLCWFGTDSKVSSGKQNVFFTFAKQLMLKDISSSLCFQKFSSWKQDIKKWVKQLLFQEMLCLRTLEIHHRYLGVLWPVTTHVLVLWRSVLCCTELYFLVTST